MRLPENRPIELPVISPDEDSLLGFLRNVISSVMLNRDLAAHIVEAATPVAQALPVTFHTESFTVSVSVHEGEGEFAPPLLLLAEYLYTRSSLLTTLAYADDEETIAECRRLNANLGTQAYALFALISVEAARLIVLPERPYDPAIHILTDYFKIQIRQRKDAINPFGGVKPDESQ